MLVTHETDHVAVFLERLDNAFFVGRRKPREDIIHRFDRLFQQSVARSVKVFDLAVEQDFFCVDADFAANFSS